METLQIGKSKNFFPVSTKSKRKKIFHDGRPLPEDLIEAIEDVRLRRNLYGPFNNANDAIKSIL